MGVKEELWGASPLLPPRVPRTRLQSSGLHELFAHCTFPPLRTILFVRLVVCVKDLGFCCCYLRGVVAVTNYGPTLSSIQEGSINSHWCRAQATHWSVQGKTRALPKQNETIIFHQTSTYIKKSTYTSQGPSQNSFKSLLLQRGLSYLVSACLFHRYLVCSLCQGISRGSLSIFLSG